MRFATLLAHSGWFALTLLTGCGTYSGSDRHDAFREEQVAKIELNRTTRRQIIEWFGPPADIARKGTPRDRDNVAAEDYFGFFASTLITGNSVVYRYRNVGNKFSETAAGVPLCPVRGCPGIGGTISRSTSNERNDLWILFDERTGLVQDYIVQSPDKR